MVDSDNFFVTTGTDNTHTYRIYINKDKANVEFTEVLSGASSAAQIAEAINSFSALSGPVTVVKETYHEIKVTFAAIDGDVPELKVEKIASSSLSWSVHTLQEGWSFFAGHTARLENVQPGSVINITSQEEVTFDIATLSAGKLVFSYDGHVGGTAIAKDSITKANVATAVKSIKDNKGATKLNIGDDGDTADAAGGATAAGNDQIVINMPKGMDGSKLELLLANGGTAAGITKSVKRNNNGRSFKVKRVENKVIDLTTGVTAPTTTSLQADTNNRNAVKFDEIQFKQAVLGTDCAALSAVVPAYLHVTDITHNADSTDYATGTIAADASDCGINVFRTTIVVDSMPDTVNRDAYGRCRHAHLRTQRDLLCLGGSKG